MMVDEPLFPVPQEQAALRPSLITSARSGTIIVPDEDMWMSALAKDYYDFQALQAILAAVTPAARRGKQTPFVAHMPTYRVSEPLRRGIDVLLTGRACPHVPWTNVSDFQRAAVWLLLRAWHLAHNRTDAAIETALTEHELLLEEAAADYQMSQVRIFVDRIVHVGLNLVEVGAYEVLLEKLHYYDMRIRRMEDKGWRKVYARVYHGHPEIRVLIETAIEQCPDDAYDGTAGAMKTQLVESRMRAT